MPSLGLGLARRCLIPPLDWEVNKTFPSDFLVWAERNAVNGRDLFGMRGLGDGNCGGKGCKAYCAEENRVKHNFCAEESA